MGFKIIIFLLMATIDLSAQNQRKQEVAEKIYEDLIAGYGSNKSAPHLKLVPKNSSRVIAQYVNEPVPTVLIDEELYDICVSFERDSANALSIILAHELAHHYNNHSWCSDYAFAFRNSGLGATLSKVSKQSKIEKESMADSYGLFYSLIAGYYPFDVFNELIDRIYDHYKLPDNVLGYPTKQERNAISRIQRDKVLTLVPVFEAGVILQYLKRYNEAAYCFEYLTRLFPSREMYNNYGVCKILQAINLNTLEHVAFIYPLEIDASSRIYPQSSRSSDSIDRQKQFGELVKQAKTAFERAIELDHNYLSAYINLACLYDIKGNYQASLGLIRELEGLGIKEENPDLLLIKAISMYHSGNENESKIIMDHISKNHGDIYEYNQKLLSISIESKNDARAIESWKDYWVRNHVFTSIDTCDGRYRELGDISKTIGSIELKKISEFLLIGKAVIEGKSLLIIRSQQGEIVANLNILPGRRINLSEPNSRFAVNGGKCFSIELPGASWFVVFKNF